ncbi:hypothetical protein AP9108_30085 [Arthrospira sp. PCC 9108]|nr:hypothetical protein AP9108_30085 [Arthrospira sp. PCC 9108]
MKRSETQHQLDIVGLGFVTSTQPTPLGGKCDRPSSHVGWVKRSETQHQLDIVGLGFVTSTQPTPLGGKCDRLIFSDFPKPQPCRLGETQ